MQSHEFTFTELPGLTFTITRDAEPSEQDTESFGPPLPPEWITIEARDTGGDIVMSGGMLGPTPPVEESADA